MKYLYYIFRLFKCKHKWKNINNWSMNAQDGRMIGAVYVHQCTKCKSIKEQRVTV